MIIEAVTANRGVKVHARWPDRTWDRPDLTLCGLGRTRANGIWTRLWPSPFKVDCQKCLNTMAINGLTTA